MRFRWITNIPTPYRNHRYAVMSRVLPAHGIELSVDYMAWTEHDRHWRFADADLDHPHRVHRSATAVVRGADLHLSPELVRDLRADRPDVALVGGWAGPTALALPWALPADTVRILGTETNESSSAVTGGLAPAVRRTIIRRYDAFEVPGRRSWEHLRRLAPEIADRPVLELPNFVDEAVFRDGVDAARTRRDELRADLGVDGQVWVCPARLEPRKGVDGLLPLLAGLEGVTLAVAGTGSLRDELARRIERDRLPVLLLGQCDEARMVELYAAADVFVLPSLRDPNPLSTVEAAAAGLPLVVSERAGNVDEVLADANGWRYDPDRPEAMAAMLREVASTAPAELAEMGARSRGVHQRTFDSEVAVERFAASLEAAVQRVRGGWPGGHRPSGMAPRRLATSALDPAWSLAPTRAGRIVYYHSVHPETDRSHRPDALARQLEWLVANGYRSVAMRDVASVLGAAPDDRWVAITFDDGYQDNLEWALPLLQEAGMTATIYVVSGLVRDPAASSDEGNKLYGGRPMLTPTDLRDLHAAGIEIASHGHTHRLAASVAASSADGYLDDVATSRAALSEWIGAPVESYAYPNGQRGAFSELTRDLLGKAGFTNAATTIWGAPGPDDDLMALPRCEMRNDDTLADVIAKMSGRRDHRRLYQLARDRSVAW